MSQIIYFCHVYYMELKIKQINGNVKMSDKYRTFLEGVIFSMGTGMILAFCIGLYFITFIFFRIKMRVIFNYVIQ